ncbi:alpha/beta fold hydrolase [Usitatibacter palustris]|uniref:Aminoacrylate hydrolase RutD n=1 Tax=Usitatibacter palustris TaxID=2732487 RepID=A0A6M4H3Y2_9PROT|nr:alpha/beta fold hydrolase [Usitatibacter palustris]QJR13992.1 Putative aminoacrylate hydrolase RutD [Usitatibacter palustris]
MSKPTLLLIPGLLNDERLWQSQIADLKHHATCVVGDITTADSIAGMAKAVLAKVPTGHIAVAGLSMGGYVALEIARQVPNRVVGMALLNTNARPDSDQATEDRKRMMKMAETDFDRVVNGLLPKMFTAEHQRDAALTTLFKSMATKVGKDAYIRQQTANIGRIDSRPHLAAIKCPTLVIAGRDDALMPLAVLQELANGIKDARFVVADKCGHLSAIEQPRLVALNLVHWISSLK